MSIPAATIQAAEEIKNLITLQRQNEKSNYSEDKTVSPSLLASRDAKCLEAKS